MRHQPVEVTSFYRFFPLTSSEVAVKRLALEAQSARLELSGLVILAEEGCNGTVAGSSDSIEIFKRSLDAMFGSGDWRFKDSRCSRQPFPRFRVKIRPEIVTTRADITIREMERRGDHSSHLTPAEWQAVLDSGEDVVLLDTRNRYETQLGTFEGCIDPQIDNFKDFAQFVEKSGIPKDKKVLMYCTGGIRCEKASVEMEKQGYSQVYQLDGGILRYLEEFPHRKFNGECFVFDGRVALDQNLQPTTNWKLCPHCGQPGNRPISCSFCGDPAWVCEDCEKLEGGPSCSHDCEWKLSHHPSRRATHSTAISIPGARAPEADSPIP